MDEKNKDQKIEEDELKTFQVPFTPRESKENISISPNNYNKPTKEHHFSGYRHRMNKEAKIREIQEKQKE